MQIKPTSSTSPPLPWFHQRPQKILNDTTRTFILRGYRSLGDKIAKFRTPMKIHKNPWKWSPIISKCGIILECVSKWLDFKLQKLIKLMPAVVKDSQMVREELISLDLLKNKRIFTAGAVSMYTNIDLGHAMWIMLDWMNVIPENFQDWDFNHYS